MNSADFLQYCMAKPGAEQSVQNCWHANQIRVGGIMFAMVNSMYHPSAVEIKTSCQQARQLRSTCKDIVPSSYLNKAHWSTIFLDGEVNDSLLYRLIDGSYRLALSQVSDIH